MAEMVRIACSRCFVNEDEEKTNSDLDERNRTTFLYRLQHSELLYLGEFTIGRKKRTLKRPSGASRSAADYDFEYYKKQAYQLNGTDEDHTVVVSATDDEITIEFDEKAPYRLTVLGDYMQSYIRRYSWLKGKDKPSSKKIADAIIKTVKICNSMDSIWQTEFSSDIYQITQNTLDNTRDLMKNGYNLDLSKWEDLDGLQARLDAGETIFAVTVADAGDGEGDTKVYSLDGQWIFEDLPFEILCSDN